MERKNTERTARPVGLYEIRFAVDAGAQEWAGLPQGALFAEGETGPGFTDAKITLPAYTLEEAVLDLLYRAKFRGWRIENIAIKSVTPAPKIEAGPEED